MTAKSGFLRFQQRLHLGPGSYLVNDNAACTAPELTGGSSLIISQNARSIRRNLLQDQAIGDDLVIEASDIKGIFGGNLIQESNI